EDFSRHETRAPPSNARASAPNDTAGRPFFALPDSLGQTDRLERTHAVVRAGVGEDTLIEARAEVPMIALVVFVAIESPDAADHDQRTDAIVPKIAQIMKAQISPGIRAFDSDVIVNNDFGQPEGSFGRFRVLRAGRAGVVTERANLPFRIDDRAIIRRQLGLGYVS